MKFGLLGRKLGHSYSPRIFQLLGGYQYDLFEKEPEAIGEFLKNGDFDGDQTIIFLHSGGAGGLFAIDLP